MPRTDIVRNGATSSRKALRPRLPQVQRRFRLYAGTMPMTLPPSVAKMTLGIMRNP